MTHDILSEHDIDEFKERVEEAADEHADRAIKAVIADLNLNLERHGALDPDSPVRRWAICLLIKLLGARLKRT